MNLNYRLGMMLDALMQDVRWVWRAGGAEALITFGSPLLMWYLIVYGLVYENPTARHLAIIALALGASYMIVRALEARVWVFRQPEIPIDLRDFRDDTYTLFFVGYVDKALRGAALFAFGPLWLLLFYIAALLLLVHYRERVGKARAEVIDYWAQQRQHQQPDGDL